jgi:hypothetical protein
MKSALACQWFLLLVGSTLPSTSSAFTTVTSSSGSSLNKVPPNRFQSVKGSSFSPVSRTKRANSRIFQQEQKNQNEQVANNDSLENSSMDFNSRFLAEARATGEALSLLYGYLSRDDEQVTPNDIVQICDEIDLVIQSNNPNNLLIESLALKQKALELSRYHLLVKLMKKDYSAYVETAKFLSPTRINRLDLPNVQDVPYNDIMPSMAVMRGNNGDDKNNNSNNQDTDSSLLVDDCTLENMQYQESLLDKILLSIFRNLVEKNTGGISSPKKGIEGLLEQGRTFMLQPNQTPQAQHTMVKETLGGLMTPFLPPFYRIFMSGIVPNVGTPWDGKQLGPWFYAPWLTTLVTPTFFGFLVGPSRPNRRRDGQRGGLVVEKCKFLQESGCKGLCLHQCKIPAQEFFKGELGLDLTVSPNFATQECQWSFGEKPLAPEEDPSFPGGCLKGCESRLAMMVMAQNNGTSDASLLSCSR